jgi:hypothetical protein
MTRGFVIIAQDTDKVSYTNCAKALELSIKKVMPNSNVSILTGNMLPYGNLGGYFNDWQVYEASPYDETIKLEADMIIPRNIEHWWDILNVNDVVVSTHIRNFKGELSDTRVYRKFIDENNLPDTYNSITYFKKSETAKLFYTVVRDIFEHWDEYKAILKCNPQEEVSTDWVYAIACHIVGIEKTTLPNFTEMSMIHMKQYINGIPSEDWTKTLVYELLPESIRVNTYTQSYPFHYHVKSFSDKLLESYLWNK